MAVVDDVAPILGNFRVKNHRPLIIVQVEPEFITLLSGQANLFEVLS